MDLSLFGFHLSPFPQKHLILRLSPGLSAVQQCAQNTGSVDLDLVIFRQLLVGSYSLGQAGNGSGCLALLFGPQSRA